MKRINGDELQTGNVVWFFGRPHLITTIEPYRHPILGNGLIAHGTEGWSIALYPGDRIEIESVESECRCSGIYGTHTFEADGCNFGPGRFRFQARYAR